MEAQAYPSHFVGLSLPDAGEGESTVLVIVNRACSGRLCPSGRAGGLARRSRDWVGCRGSGRAPTGGESLQVIESAQLEAARQRACEYFELAGIVITAEERANIEEADFGLGELGTTGLELVVYVNTRRVCAKELVLFPRQTCPEHRHPPIGDSPGKEETFRVRMGTVYLNVEGEPTSSPGAKPPSGRKAAYSVFHEIVLGPGEQYTIWPNTLHWFQSGDDGAVVSEFSTESVDEADVFTDPDIQRVTVVG